MRSVAFRATAWLWAIVALALSSPQVSRAQVTQADSLALVAFYNAMDGPNWDSNVSPWITGPVTNWGGVTVEGGRVTKLMLNNADLNGTIPAEFSDLTGLVTLQIAGNGLSGTLPTVFWTLPNLSSLQLDNNQFSGVLPAAIGGATGLTSISIQNNQLSGNIPAEIASLPILTGIGLAGNTFSGMFPPAIWQMTGLVYLDVSNNDLSGSLPASIGHMANLSSLILSGNQFTGDLPSDLGLLVDMTTLLLDDNRFTGSIPQAIAQWPGYLTLRFANNLFTDLPDFSASVYVGGLSAERNRFEFDDLEPNVNIATDTPFTYRPQDSVGTALDTLVSIGEPLTLTMKVGGTQNTYRWFKDDYDEQFGQTDSTLTVASVGPNDAGVYFAEVRNALVPKLILESRQMRVQVTKKATLAADSLALVAFYNATGGPGWRDARKWLTGPVSTWGWVRVEVGRVTTLQLIDQNLTGSIPPEIGQLTGLTYLRISDNPNLTGSIPPEIGQLTELTTLEISGNPNLVGEIPSEVSRFTGLTRLWLANNGLTGSVPGEAISQMGSLQYLQLDGNEFDHMPDLPAAQLFDVAVDNNRLEFGDLEPNVGKGWSVFKYAPQKSFSEAESTFVRLGDPVTMTSAARGSQNAYQWFKDDVALDGQTDTTLILASVQGVQMGVYQVRVTNALVPNLTLVSGPRTVWTLPIVADSLALLELYNTTGGGSWTNRTNWLIGPVSTWHGVTVTNGRVTSLELTGNELSGKLTPRIGDLTSLTSLSLSFNNLDGEIPPEIEQLTVLTDLWLNNNKLSGYIPPEVGRVTQLKILDLGANEFDSVSAEIGQLALLEYLGLNQNRLKSLPAEISNLSKLVFLLLNDNELFVLPDLSALGVTGLSMENNKLEFDDIEPFMDQGIELFTYEPQLAVGVGPQRKWVVLDTPNPGDPVQWDLSIAAGGSQNLYQWFKGASADDAVALEGETNEKLMLTSTSKDDAGVYYAKVTSPLVPALALRGQAITVEVFSGYEADLRALSTLYATTYGPGWDVKFNWLHEEEFPYSWPRNPTIPLDGHGWYGVTYENGRVRELDLSRNYLGGHYTRVPGIHLPYEMSLLTAATKIDLSYNLLSCGDSGTKPPLTIVFCGWAPPPVGKGSSEEGEVLEISNPLFSLEILQIGFNEFSGELPPEIGNLSKLTKLDLGHNQFSGSLPEELGQLVALDSLILANNDFSGEMPLSMTALVNLSFFDFGHSGAQVPADPAFQSWLDAVPSVLTAIEFGDEPGAEYGLSPAYPNPFGQVARFTLRIEKTQKVNIAVYNLLGQRVALLHDGQLTPDTAHEFTLDGGPLGAGVYVISVRGETFQKSGRVVVAR